MKSTRWYTSFIATTLGAVLFASVGFAEEPKSINVPPGDLITALKAFTKQTGVEVVYLSERLQGIRTPGVNGTLLPEDALDRMLMGTALAVRKDSSGAVLITSKRSATSSDSSPAAEEPGLKLAQTSMSENKPSAENQTTDESGRIQEIVVTAQKRSERLQDVPLAVSAIGQEQIRGLGAKTFDDISRSVPGLTVTRGRSAVPAIRGIVSGAGAATVGYYVNDTPIQVRPSYLGNVDLELYDLERVEVLRGPQGTLYGGSAMGGTIRFLTPTPSLTQTSGRVSAEVSGTKEGDPSYEAGAAFGTPLIEGVLGFRGSVSSRVSGGYVDRVSRTTGAVVTENGNEVRTTQAQAALLWQATSALTVSPSFLYQSQQNDDMPFFSSELRPLQQKNVIREPGHDHVYLPSLNVSYDFGIGTLTSVTSALVRNEKQVLDYSTLVPEFLTLSSVLPGFENYLALASRSNTQRNVSQEIRFASPSDGRFQWIAGAFYSRQRQVLDFPLYEPQLGSLVQAVYGLPLTLAFGADLLPGGLSLYAKTQATEKQTAAFGELTYELVHDLKLTAGLRVSRSEFEFFQFTDGPLGGGRSESTGAQRATPVTPKAGLSYNLNPDVLVYASAAKGFRVGGVNAPFPQTRCAADLATLTAGAAPSPTYDSDGLWASELGLKSLLFDRRLAANISVYRIKWTDIQQAILLPGCGYGYTANFGDARSQGAELELTATPLPGLKVTANASYNDAELTSDVFGARVSGVQQILGLSGDRLPFTPKWAGSTSVEYRVEWSSTMTAYARGDYQYSGSYFRSAPPGRVGYIAPIYSGESYDYSSLRIGGLWQNWDVAVFVNNLTDARPVIGADTGITPSSGNYLGTTLRPRTFGLSVERSF